MSDSYQHIENTVVKIPDKVPTLVYNLVGLDRWLWCIKERYYFWYLYLRQNNKYSEIEIDLVFDQFKLGVNGTPIRWVDFWNEMWMTWKSCHEPGMICNFTLLAC